MPEPKLCNSIDEFRKAARESEDGKKPIEARVRASFDTEVKADAETRTLTFTISTSSVDRMGDTIKVDGWNLDMYRRNPVVLWAHDASLLPVAKSNKVWMEGQALKSVAEFTPPGMAKFNDTVFEMYKAGFLSATSVGFAPLKYAFTDDPQRRYGIDFLEQELLEFSAVPVPANGEALIEGKSAGINVVPLLDWCELQMKRVGDHEKIIKLAEGILGSSGDDIATLAWAKRIVAASKGISVIQADRLTAMQALAEEFRSDAKKSSGSKGASGIYRRCANRLDKALLGQEPSEPEAPELPAKDAPDVAAGFAEIAGRRLKTVRHKAS